MTRTLLLALGLLLVTAGCDDQVLATCRDIPDGGCPVASGVACSDPACAAAYACQADGTWAIVQVCAAQDASIGDDAASPVDAGTRDVSTDVEGAFGGPGCIDLQPPDCALGTALACSAGCCGCEALFVCRAGGWDPWGACDEAGVHGP